MRDARRSTADAAAAGGRRATAGGDLVPLARLSALADGEPFAVRIDGLDLLVLRLGSGVRVFQGACPHEGTNLGSASCAGGQLTCSAHGWRFDCASGARLGAAGPGLHAFTAELRGDEVYVQRAELEAWRERRSRTNGAAHGPLREVDELPGPRGLPLLGNALALDLPHLHDVLDGWARRYGPLYAFRIGRRPVVAVGDAHLATTVLRERPDRYRRWSNILEITGELSLAGVFSVEGDDWRRQRPMASQALDVAHVGGFFDRLATIVRRLHGRWERSARSGAPVEIQKDLMRFTVDVTTALALGHDLDTLEAEGDAIQRHLEKVFPVLIRRINAVFPYWRHVRLPSDRAVDRAVEAVRAATAPTIEAARARVRDRGPGARPADFLEALVSARDPSGAPLTDGEIFANVLTMLLAGEDTTANTISWMAHLLATHPEVQARARAEVDAVLGGARFLGALADAGRLPYVEAVLDETLRVKPVAPLLFLETCRDEVLGDVRLPRGTRLALLTRHYGMKDESFADPWRFDPERWLRGGARPGHRPEVFMPFGGGPRYCPGRHLAVLETKAVACMLLGNFEVEHVEGPGPVRERFCFTMMPENLLVRLRGR